MVTLWIARVRALVEESSASATINLRNYEAKCYLAIDTYLDSHETQGRPQRAAPGEIVTDSARAGFRKRIDFEALSSLCGAGMV